MAKGVHWPGLGPRLREAIGRRYTNSRGNPDVIRFALEYRFVLNNVYRWIGGQAVPTYDNLLKLAAALEISPAWLCFGDDEGRAVQRPTGTEPVTGGSGARAPEPPVALQVGVRPDGQGQKRGDGALCKPAAALVRKPLAPVRTLPTRRRMAS